MAIDDNNDPCLVIDGGGYEYHEFSCLYPSIEPVYFEFEKKFDATWVLSFMDEYSWLPWIAVGLYGASIVGGKRYFATAEAWNLRTVMAYWNLSLSVFSFVGAFKTVPHLLHNVSTMSSRDVLCNNPRYTYGSGSTGFWCALFTLSKFPELLDTFFIVVHKKPLIFLHWYHHITVLLYTWYSYKMASPPSIFFVSMNYCVHAVMYGYYFCTIRKCLPKWFHPMVITACQISQMWIGVLVTIGGFYYYRQNDPKCEISHDNMKAAFLMYGSYLALFCRFFIGKYDIVAKRTNNSKKTIKTA